MTKLGLTAAAVVIASFGVAAAQSSHVGNTQHKCWDNVKNQVRDQSVMASHNEGTSTPDKAGDVRSTSRSAEALPSAGGSNTGLPSAMNRPGTSPLSNASPPTRPREAEGLPDCNS